MGQRAVGRLPVLEPERAERHNSNYASEVVGVGIVDGKRLSGLIPVLGSTRQQGQGRKTINWTLTWLARHVRRLGWLTVWLEAGRSQSIEVTIAAIVQKKGLFRNVGVVF